MKKCNKCGSDVGEQAKYCPSCGFAVQSELKYDYKKQENNYTHPAENKKFYQKLWFAWTMVVLFFPVGIFLLWKYKHHSLVVRSIITGSFILIGLFGNVSNSKNTPPKQQPTQSVQVADKATQQADFKKWKASVDAQLKDADAIWEKWSAVTNDLGKGKISRYQAYDKFKEIGNVIDKQDSKISKTKPPSSLSAEDQKILNGAVDNMSSVMSYRKMATERMIDMIDSGDYKPSKAEAIAQTIQEGNGYMIKAVAGMASVQVSLGIENKN